MPVGQSAPQISPVRPSLTFPRFRWFGALLLASAVCLVDGPCSRPTTVGSGVSADMACAHVGCSNLIINGKRACAALPVDFKRLAQTAAAAAPRLAQVPVTVAYNKLHSRPGATKVIYLDFDGHITGEPWSATPIVTTPYDLDSNPTTFSTQEQTNIIEMWNRVSECYSMWDVDVTTEDPTVANLINSGGGDTKWGMRVLFGDSNPSPAPNAGGVAFLFSFGDSNALGEDVPCFVLKAGVGTGAKVNADAAIHEVGHTLGMQHDGLNTATAQNQNQSAYYLGHGTGKTAWAPHMGAGYYVPIVHWSKGEYFDANNFQDDLSIIPQIGNFALRPDDFTDTRTSAKAIPGTAGSSAFAVNVSGIIGTSTDTDWFKITCGSGLLKFDAVGGPANTMLDIELTLYDSKGAVVVVANPPADVIASISQSVTSGVYYLKIDGVGVGTPLSPTPTGYTDYCSLGQYTITGSFSTKGLKGAPLLTVPGDLFYGIKELPKPINPGIKVADQDNPTLPSATVTITNPVLSQDLLSLVVNPQTMGNITASYDSTKGVLTLTSANATATQAQFQNALRAVCYSNSSVNPTKTPRKVDFQVSDGTITSNILTSTVTIGYFYITASYDAPNKTLTIGDDAADNSFAITLRAGLIAVEGAGSTRIGNSLSNTQSVTFPFSSDVKIVVNCTAGNDSVSLVSVKSSSTIINLGDGNDTVNLTYSNITTLNVNGGAGTDVLKPVATTIGTKTLVSVP